MSARITQQVVEVLLSNTDAQVRETQQVTEVLLSDSDAQSRVTQIVVEALVYPKKYGPRLQT